jgi:zinc protease
MKTHHLQQIGQRRVVAWMAARVIVSVAVGSATVIAQDASDSAITRATLKNGLRVVIVRNALAPVVTTQINYLVGSNEAPTGFPGMAHALEHMMFRGSPGLSSAQLSSLIAAMGGNFNANTQQIVTQYFFTVPTGDLETALRIEAVRMRDVLATDALWRQERGAIEQEVAQDYSNPQYLFYSRLLAQMFAGTPYEHDALGTRPSFQKTTGAMLKDFHRKWYAPNNAILVIVGDVNPDAALATVKQLFESIPARTVPARPKIALQPLKPATIEVDSDLPYGLAAVAYRLPGFNDPIMPPVWCWPMLSIAVAANFTLLPPRAKLYLVVLTPRPLPMAGFGYANAAFPRGQDSAL